MQRIGLQGRNKHRSNCIAIIFNLILLKYYEMQLSKSGIFKQWPGIKYCRKYLPFMKKVCRPLSYVIFDFLNMILIYLAVCYWLLSNFPLYMMNNSDNRIVLLFWQTWAHVFQSFPELKEVCKQYQELKTKGVEFPLLDVEKANQAYIPSKVWMLGLCRVLILSVQFDYIMNAERLCVIEYA